MRVPGENWRESSHGKKEAKREDRRLRKESEQMLKAIERLTPGHDFI